MIHRLWAAMKPEILTQPVFLKSSLQKQTELTGSFSSNAAYATEQVFWEYLGAVFLENHSSNRGMFLEHLG